MYKYSHPFILGIGPLAKSQMVGKRIHKGAVEVPVSRVHYKTGRKDFSLADVRQGLDLQMLLYLFTIAREGSEHFGHEIEPSGVLYMPARDPVLAAERNITPLELAAMREEYDMRRRLIVAGFNRIGLTCREPRGAFYAFPCIRSTGLSDEEFCERLLYAERVAIVPGSAFGRGGDVFVRASYCYSTEHISEAIRRIERFLKTL